MKKFNKVMSVIQVIAGTMAVEALAIIGINEIYYELPSGIDTPLAWGLCIYTGIRLSTWTVNEVSRIIKG